MLPGRPVRLKQQAVGDQVRGLRERRGLTLRALAAATDFSPSVISQLENGLVSPSISSREEFAFVLEGAVDLTLGPDTFRRWVNPGAGAARVLVVGAP
jgi:transcriptional regulator with XRE-family HTH domain